jgi:hypothetical protein
LRIPELDCDDYLSYQYVGTRYFVEKPVQIEGGHVSFDDPSDRLTRADRFGVGAVLGYGMRAQPSTDDAFGMHWEGNMILNLRRPPVSWWSWDTTRFLKRTDLELQLGLLLARQPYCSTGDCERQENVWYWRFPILLGLHHHLEGKWTLGHSLGFAPTTYVWHVDRQKALRPVLFASRLHVGYQISRAVAGEIYCRLFANERVITRTLGVEGVASEEIRSGGARVSLFLGLALRIDDLI